MVGAMSFCTTRPRAQSPGQPCRGRGDDHGQTVSASFSLQVGISADGRRVAYSSRATNLMAGQADGNSVEDIFLYDRVAGTNVLVSHTAASASTAGSSDSLDPS